MIGRLRAGPEPAPVEEAMRVHGVWNVDRAQAALNVFGGAAFAVGSLLFLNSALERWGIVLFVVGSFGMFVGALAVWHERYGPRRLPGRHPGRHPAATQAATHAPEPVTSPAAPGSRPATLRGD